MRCQFPCDDYTLLKWPTLLVLNLMLVHYFHYLKTLREAWMFSKEKVASHPFHVFNSQSGKDYNTKRASKKYSNELVDELQFEYTYYSVQCVHYDEARSRALDATCTSVSIATSLKLFLPKKGLNLVDLLEGVFHFCMHGCAYPAGIVFVYQKAQIIACCL